MGVLTGLVMIAIHPLFLSVYRVTEETLRLAKMLLILQSLLLCVRADSMALVVGIFRAAGDTIYACILDTGTVWLAGVPLIFLGVWLGLPMWGVVLLGYSDEISKVLIGLIHLRKKKWVRNVTAQLQNG